VRDNNCCDYGFGIAPRLALENNPHHFTPPACPELHRPARPVDSTGRFHFREYMR